MVLSKMRVFVGSLYVRSEHEQVNGGAELTEVVFAKQRRQGVTVRCKPSAQYICSLQRGNDCRRFNVREMAGLIAKRDSDASQFKTTTATREPLLRRGEHGRRRRFA